MQKLKESQIREEIRRQLIRESIFKSLKSKIGKVFGKKNSNINKNEILSMLKQSDNNLIQSSRILMFLKYAESLLSHLTDTDRLMKQRRSYKSTKLTAVRNVNKKINEIIDLLDHLKLEIDKFRSIKHQSFTNESLNFLNNPELASDLILKMDAIMPTEFSSNLRKEFDQSQTITQDIQNLCDNIFEKLTGRKVVKAKKSKEVDEVISVVETIIIEWCEILKKGFTKISDTVMSIKYAIDISDEKDRRNQNNLDFNTDSDEMPFKSPKPKTRKWEDLYNPKVQVGPDRSKN